MFLTLVELDQALQVKVIILEAFSAQRLVSARGEGEFLDAVERWSLCNPWFLVLTDTGYLALLLQELIFCCFPALSHPQVLSR